MDHHILIYDKHNSIVNYMLSDLAGMENVHLKYVISMDCSSDNKSKYYLKKGISKIVWALKKNWWINKTRKIPGSIIVTNEAVLGLTKRDLKHLKQTGNTVIGLFIDPLKANYVTISKAKSLMNEFDVIYTFDPFDAKEYGFQYTNQLYSPVSLLENRAEKKSDLYYIGHVKGREEFILKLVELGRQNGAMLDINLAGSMTGKIPGVSYLKGKIPYEDVIKELQSTDCILDITQEDQSGITLRYYEAVVYNKKLLTNNEGIKQLPYFDERYMKIYSTVEEIDWEWVRNGDVPSYGYRGTFSPVYLLQRIEEVC